MFNGLYVYFPKNLPASSLSGVASLQCNGQVLSFVRLVLSAVSIKLRGGAVPRNIGGSIVMGVPQMDGEKMDNPSIKFYKWMMTGGSPILETSIYHLVL